jgi:hypothetical protein
MICKPTYSTFLTSSKLITSIHSPCYCTVNIYVGVHSPCYCTVNIYVGVHSPCYCTVNIYVGVHSPCYCTVNIYVGVYFFDNVWSFWVEVNLCQILFINIIACLYLLTLDLIYQNSPATLLCLSQAKNLNVHLHMYVSLFGVHWF